MIRPLITLGLGLLLLAPAHGAPQRPQAPAPKPAPARAAMSDTSRPVKVARYTHEGCPLRRGYHLRLGAAANCAERAGIRCVQVIRAGATRATSVEVTWP